MRAVALLLPLACCSSVGPPPSVCPSIVTYSKDEQSRLADEMAAPPYKPMVDRFLADYHTLRNRLRTCQ